MGRFQFACRALLIREHRRQSVYRLRFPAPELIRMNALCGRNLRESLFFLEHFQHELGLEVSTVLFSHDRDSTLSQPFFVSGFTGPLYLERASRGSKY